MSSSPKNQDEFSDERRALLEAMLKEEGIEPSSEQRIPRRGKIDAIPLSFAQQRLWFLEQLDPGSPAYTIPEVLRLEGPLHPHLLEHAINEVIRRHEALRTTFRTLEGEPVQVITPALSLRLPVMDLRDLSESEQKSRVRQLAAEDAHRPFDLQNGPLLRAGLLQLNPQTHVLLFNIHHIVSDAWSLGVLFKEIAILYTALFDGKATPLPELPIQYADFAVWQRHWLQGKALEEQLAYWKQCLGGSLPLIELPTDRPRPAVQTYNGSVHSFAVSKSVSEALIMLSRKSDVTLFITLLSAFYALLHRYTAQEDLLVGIPIANRTRLEVEDLIGFFVNTLVLRSDVSGDPTFLDLQTQVREVVLGASAHQDIPFEKLVEELRPERSESHSPLFQVMFVFQNAPRPPLQFAGIRVIPQSVDTGTSKFELSLYLADSEKGLRGTWEYNTDLFDASTIARLSKHFQTMLEGIVADPGRRLSELPLLSEAEREQILVEWNSTDAAFSRSLTLPQLFEAQVERTPEAMAVVFEQQSLTYRELNGRANQLAHFLRSIGVAPEVRVGLCLDRSLEMVIALLGILKAGSAYLPLDPDFPAERLAFMLDDAQVPVLLSSQRLLDVLPRKNAETICLDRDWESRIQPHSDDNPLGAIQPQPLAGPQHLAYVLYTSGSTGRPKGVMIEHHSLVNFLHALTQQFPMTAQDTLLAVTTLSFDIAGLELYLPLLQGARLEIATHDVSTDGRRLAEQMERSSITVLQATPATWRLLLEAGWKGQARLQMLCGGEALPLSLARELLPRGAALWNLYGPTETTIWSSFCRITPQDTRITIGRPLANTRFYLLDKAGQPVPVGVAGELYIGGEGVARGYLNRAELTAERFLADPFSKLPGARMYRTGDLARYLPDGRLECLGRVDHQIKLRGFRIELGEIEAVLRRLEGVAEAVVVAREDSPGDQRLVAYLVADAAQEPSFSQLRKALRAQLPDYMIPAAFVRLDALPLTPNGKIDRNALLPPEGFQLQAGVSYVAPRTEMEQFLATVWQKLLKVERVGIHDNFFDLGGHSLLSMRVVYEIEQHQGRRISPRQLIFQSLEQIAADCQSRREAAVASPALESARKVIGAIRGVFSGSGKELG